MTLTSDEFKSWSVQKIHDRLIQQGQGDLALLIRSTTLGLGWLSPAQQVGQLNGALARAFLVLTHDPDLLKAL